jgi:hypothetical protein
MLHKTSFIKGFHLLATDGEIGHVDDFLVDESWNLRYLVVDTSNQLGGRWVLISPRTIESIDVPNKQFRVALSRDEIQRSPPIEAAPIELIETLPPFIII